MVGIISTEITLVPSFVKIGSLFQKFKVYVHTAWWAYDLLLSSKRGKSAKNRFKKKAWGTKVAGSCDHANEFWVIGSRVSYQMYYFQFWYI